MSEEIDDRLKALIKSGKEKGYLTYSQLVDYLPDDDTNTENIEPLLLLLENQGLDLLDELETEEREKARRSFQRVLAWQRNHLRQVRLCQSTPESQRMLPQFHFRFDCGTVYLIRRGENGPYKIGMTREPFRKRRNQLQRKSRFILSVIATYRTVVPFSLEQALHRFFHEFRIKRQGERAKGEREYLKGELFRLPPERVDGFPQIVANIERWVLLATEARLELEIMRMEAAHPDLASEKP